jgi:hypothetical protein
MPIRIPTYTQQESVSGRIQNDAGQGGQAIAAGVQQLGQGITNVGRAAGQMVEAYQQEEDRAARSWASKATAEAELGMSRMFSDTVALETATETDATGKVFRKNPVGMAKRFLDGLDASIQETGKLAEHPKAKEYLGASMQSLRLQYARKALDEESKAAQAYISGNLDDMQDSRKKLLQDSSLADLSKTLVRQLGAVGVDVEGLYSDPADKQGFIGKARSDLVGTALDKRVKTDRTFISALAGGEQQRAVVAPENLRMVGKAIHPEDLGALAQAYGAQHGIDPALLYGLWMQESGGNPSAVNKKSGATGLGQFMPDTAAKFGINPLDPKQNAEASAKYLSQLIAETGTVEGALKRYGGFVTKDSSGYIASVKALAKKSGVKAAPTEAQATANLESYPEWRFATAEQRDAARRTASSISAVNTQASKDFITDRSADLKSAAEAGNVDAVLTLWNQALTPENYAQAYGKDPDPTRAARERARMLPYVATAQQINSQKHMTAEQLNAVASSQITPGAGQEYAPTAAAIKIAQDAADAILKAREKDPAGWMTQNDPSTSTAWQTAAQTGDFKAYAETANAARKHYQIANPALLPPSVRNQEAQFFATAEPNQVIQRIDQMAQQWGDKNLPQVVGELSKEIPGPALWVAYGADPVVKPDLALSMRLTKDQVRQSLGPARFTAVESAVNQAFSGYRSSLLGSAPAAGAEMWDKLNDGAFKLAASYASRYGLSEGEAAQRAYDALVGNQYQIVRGEEVEMNVGGSPFAFSTSVRLPKQLPGGVGLDEFTKTTKQIAAAKLDVTGGLNSGTQDEASFKADVNRYGYFANAPSGKGLMLMYNGNAVSFQRGKTLHPIVVDFDEVSDMISPSKGGEFMQRLLGIPGEIVKEMQPYPGKVKAPNAILDQPMMPTMGAF